MNMPRPTGGVSIARVFFGSPELDPFLELPGGLLGEGEGDEGGGVDSFSEKTHGALGKDLRLSGACAGPFIDVLEDGAGVDDGFVLGGGEGLGHGRNQLRGPRKRQRGS